MAAAPSRIADTAQIPIKANNRGYAYTITLQPTPAPGTLTISFMAQGKWYDLKDNGRGECRGIDSSYGSATLNYATGSVLLTLGALPDVNTAILFSWGTPVNYTNRSGQPISISKSAWQLPHTGITPKSVILTWGSGQTANDAVGDGRIRGDITGTINYAEGIIDLEHITLPALGQEYVARHFPPEHKAKMTVLVEDLLEAYRQSIRALDWMGEETKLRALEKVDSFVTKIGYPEKWLDYSSLKIGDDLVENVRQINRFEFKRGIAKLGKPMDRSEWFMSPQTVNAYYNPVWNEIVFPAAILQFPFFDPERDDAFNYGGIGAVIGHEIGHGFDDQGSKYDASGALHNWWTDEDRGEFEKRTSALVAQYDAYIPEQLGTDSPHHVQGALTLGENIGDLGGLSIGLKAYGLALERAELTLESAPEIDGFTGVQRVLLSYARIWQEKRRSELLETLIATDPHSPDEFRCNQIVKNVSAFADTFDLKPGDGLWLEPADRVRIWS